MRHLTVLFDANCSICRRTSGWLERQTQLVPLRFVAAGSEAARSLFPDLDHDSSLLELMVIDDRGYVFQGGKAWVMCLWALEDYRSMAVTMSAPAAMRLGKRLVSSVSAVRHKLPALGAHPGPTRGGGL